MVMIIVTLNVKIPFSIVLLDVHVNKYLKWQFNNLLGLMTKYFCTLLRVTIFQLGICTTIVHLITSCLSFHSLCFFPLILMPLHRTPFDNMSNPGTCYEILHQSRYVASFDISKKYLVNWLHIWHLKSVACSDNNSIGLHAAAALF
jgi:hypothetical protein